MGLPRGNCCLGSSSQGKGNIIYTKGEIVSNLSREILRKLSFSFYLCNQAPEGWVEQNHRKDKPVSIPAIDVWPKHPIHQILSINRFFYKNSFNCTFQQWRTQPNYAILVDTRDRMTPQLTYVPQENIDIISNVKVIVKLMSRSYETLCYIVHVVYKTLISYQILM